VPYSAAGGSARRKSSSVAVIPVSLATIALARLNTDGTSDPSFGSSGRVTLQNASNSVEVGAKLTKQKDGKLVVNKTEAATVRMIFECYAQLGSAPAPKRFRNNARGVRAKRIKKPAPAGIKP
jgi:hypothetical protein